MNELRWYGPSVARQVRDEMKARLALAAEELRAQVVENISTDAPPHSLPGEFPHQISGELADSIRVETDKRSLTVRVVADADYALALELGTANMSPRPFMRRTMLQMRSRLRAIILGGAGRGRFKFTSR